MEITASVKAPDWTCTQPARGRNPDQKRSTTVPGNHAEAKSGIHRSHLFFSDDGGQTWTLGASSDAGYQ